MKDIHDVFSELISKYIDFYMTKMEFEEAWKKIEKEMSRRYKTRGKELCSSKEEIDEIIEWFKIGKTKREEELENKIKELEETIKEYEYKETCLNTKISDLELKLTSKDHLEETSKELKRKLDRVEERLRVYEDREIEACAKENRRFRAYEEYVNSWEGSNDWADCVSGAFERDAEERRELERVERLF